MRVAVTGAGGFLGRAVVRSLLQSEHEVIAVVRSDATFDDDRVDVRRCDLRTDDISLALKGADAVVHAAAQVTGSDEARFGSTVVGTERLLAALDPSAVSRLVLVSSYSVYDWEAASGLLDESAATADSPYRRDGYTVAKVWQERLVREYADATPGIDVTILRPGFVWGPGNEELAGAGLRVGPAFLVVAPASRLPLTYVDNCADAIAAAVTAPRWSSSERSAARWSSSERSERLVETTPPSPLILNIVDGPGVSAWTYAARLVAWDPALRWRVPVPYALFNAFVSLLAIVMPRICRHGGKLPGVFMQAPFHARFKPLRHSSEPASQALGWKPAVSPAEALRRTFGRAS